VRLASPFLLRSVDPPLSEAFGRAVVGVHRIGKRIALDLDGDLHLVVHLMIAGRLRWLPAGAKVPGKVGLAAFDFSTGTMVLTEAGTKRRASLYVVRGAAGLAAVDPGGLEIEGSTVASLRATLGRENHTLKRALTSPQLLSGVGNAYSDEVLHRARLSPVRWTDRLTDEEWAALHRALVEVMREWTERLRSEAGEKFPDKVTAFHDEMAVHGKYKQPCPVCGTPVQRIRHADNETNYCPRCQTGGKLLADRALSKLLKGDWPKTIEEWEERRLTATKGGN
jgi:formamidopyrimidine-DNA glycosylase